MNSHCFNDCFLIFGIARKKEQITQIETIIKNKQTGFKFYTATLQHSCGNITSPQIKYDLRTMYSNSNSCIKNTGN